MLSVANKHAGFVIDNKLHSLNNKHLYIIRSSFSPIKQMDPFKSVLVKKKLSVLLLIKLCCIVDPQTHQAGMTITIRVILQFTSLNHPWSKHLVLKVLTLRMTAQRLLQEKSPNKRTSQDFTQLN